MNRRNKQSAAFRAVALLWSMDRQFVLSALLSSSLGVCALYVPVFVLARVLDGVAAGQAFGTVLQTALAGTALLFLARVGKTLADQSGSVRSQAIAQRFETLASRKTLHMPYAMLESPQTRGMRAQIQSDRSWGSGFFGILSKLQDITYNFTGMLVSVAVVLPLFQTVFVGSGAWRLTLAASAVFVSAASALFFSAWYGRRELSAMRALTDMEKSSRFQAMSEGGFAIGYQSIKDILLYGAGRLIGPSLQAELNDLRGRTRKLSGLNALGGGVKGASAGLLLCISYAFVMLCAPAGQITVGLTTQYAQALYIFTSFMSTFIQTCAECSNDAKRLVSTMAYLDMESAGPADGKAPPPGEIASIVFENVSFRYPGSDREALRHVSLTLSAGRRAAIVGVNGSGKTTLIKLLCRLYDPDEGRILLNGVDIRTFEIQAYRQLFSVVFQDFSILSFPLGTNVSAQERCDAARAESALRRSGFGDRLERMPDGLETILYRDYSDRGVEISAGEAQKIAIARAIYKDAPIVILDEPTASLDPVAEYEVYTKFDDLIGHKSAVYISHRLSSCRFCTELFVLDRGAVVQRGSHAELLAETHGPYALLWSAQAQYYRERS